MIRRGALKDLPQLRLIYNQSIASFYSTCDTSLRSSTDRIRWFHQFTEQHPLWVYEESNMVLAYACLFPYSLKEAYNFTVEDAVYVLKKSQGKGLGSLLLKHLIQFCEKNGYHNIIARIFSKNPASINLHLSQGFKKIGHMREVAHVNGRFEDVEIYSKLIQADY